MNITIRRPAPGFFEAKFVEGSTTIDLGFLSDTEGKALACELRSAANEIDAQAVDRTDDLVEALEEALDVIRTLNGKDNSCDEPYNVSDIEALLARVKAAA